ncbi:DUF2087 domain-containing protein [Ramlibacter sp. PS4R-6]|uniref:DUF2087 domain-containing protein n=1 Tax=Ramlibacter sp. PS4R-6 TaxID=3133438 RepID=UPI0030B68BB1
MPKIPVPYAAADITSVARTLKSALDERHASGKPPPSHVELLNLLARAAGVRNFQSLKAAPPPAPAAIEVLPAGELSPLARKTLMQFDDAGRLVRLPNKFSVQRMAMWVLWTRFAPRRDYTEKEVNALLNAQHTFGDPATLRRELVEMKLLGRESDCSRYWKEPRRPDADTRAFLQAWRAKFRA